MKIKLLFTLLVFFVTVNTAYASFPVKRQLAKTNQVSETNNEVELVAAPSGSGKSQIVAAILCWLVGIIGVHRFYLGYTWQGVVQILTLGGLGIWTLIDLIRIIIGDLQPKDGAYEKTF